MSTLIQDRQPSGAPASTGGRYRGHGRSTAVSLIAMSDEQLLAAASDLTSDAKLLTKLSFSTVDAVRLAVAGNPSTLAADLERMLNRGAAVRRAVLGNPALPAKTALAVAGRPRAGDLAALASNPTLPEQLLAQCAAGPVDAQLAVASRPGCPAPVYDMLAGSDNEQVLDAVRGNPSAPRATRTRAGKKLTMIASDVAGDPRERAADPTTEPRVLAALAYSKDEIARASVAANPGTPPATLAGILSRGRFGRSVALRNPSLPMSSALDVARNPVSDDLANLAANPSATTEVLDLCSFGGGMAAYRVAAHTNTGPAVFARYSQSSNPQLLAAVADNPAAPADTRAEAGRRHAEIRAAFDTLAVVA